MRRVRLPEDEPSALETPTATGLTPAALPRVRNAPEPVSDVPGISDLERGRSAALLASLGRVQLQLDVMERRLGRLEKQVGGISDRIDGLPAETVRLFEALAAGDRLG